MRICVVMSPMTGMNTSAITFWPVHCPAFCSKLSMSAPNATPISAIAITAYVSGSTTIIGVIATASKKFPRIARSSIAQYVRFFRSSNTDIFFIVVFVLQEFVVVCLHQILDECVAMVCRHVARARRGNPPLVLRVLLSSKMLRYFLRTFHTPMLTC